MAEQPRQSAPTSVLTAYGVPVSRRARRATGRWRASARTRRHQKAILLERHGAACHWCHLVFPPCTLTLDHLIERSKGGRNALFNLVLACAPCNNERSNPKSAHAA